MLNKKKVISNYSLIQFEFIQWSRKRGMNPNKVYEKVTHMVSGFLVPVIVITCAITFGPIITTINDLGKLPLNHRSHFPVYLPKVSRINSTLPSMIIIRIVRILEVFVFFFNLPLLTQSFMVTFLITNIDVKIAISIVFIYRRIGLEYFKLTKWTAVDDQFIRIICFLFYIIYLFLIILYKYNS